MVLANYNGDVGQIFSIQVEGNTNNAICRIIFILSELTRSQEPIAESLRT